MHRLTRKELRIIEETKREGAELERQEQEAGVTEKHVKFLSVILFAVIFFLLVFGIKLLIDIAS